MQKKPRLIQLGLPSALFIQMDKPQLRLVRFFRTLRKSKIIPTLFVMLSLVFLSFKLGQMFSHSARFEYETIAKSEVLYSIIFIMR